jgi:hypothetical protein
MIPVVFAGERGDKRPIALLRLDAFLKILHRNEGTGNTLSPLQMPTSSD